MKAVTIAGRIGGFDEIASKYVIDHDIHLENAMSVIGDYDGLVPYEEDNSYTALVKSISELLQTGGFAPEKRTAADREMTMPMMTDMVNILNARIEKNRRKKSELEKKIKENEKIIRQLDTMLDFDVDLPTLFSMEFINFRFGRISKVSYNTLVTYLGDIEAVFMKTAEDENDVWGFYFVPYKEAERIDAIFASLYFEQVAISEKVVGTPRQSKEQLEAENEEYRCQMRETEKEITDTIQTRYEELSDAYITSKNRQQLADIKKYAAHSSEFFYIVGWMPEGDAKKLEKETESEPSVIFFTEHVGQIDETIMAPPTKLKNPRLLRPFEMFINMYGLPSYHEVDPTPILALTYILLYGIMFGDVGQSLVFAIGGFIVYKLKKWDLAAMVSAVGVSGTIFGFVYGSVFGNETLLEHTRLLAPMEQIGFMLISTVALGVFLIVFCILMNIINSVKMHDWGRALFTQNGLAGLVFYLSLIVLGVGTLLGYQMPTAILITLIIIGIVVMYLQEPLSELIEGKKNWFPKTGIFYVQSFFEMFDVLLSFLTNTISFLRVGAFAIIHVGMMLAVSILAGDGGVRAVIVMIIGNIIVMGLEGLLVGIQVLRLEYYEMFSRYYTGDGKEFHSLKKDRV
jgi:V/A-type H+-transporting ATPase subunit I